MKIQEKIRLAMLAALLGGVAVAGAGAYFFAANNAIEESLQNARIVIEGARALQTYTSENVTPLLQQKMKLEFLPSAIPSLAAQANLRATQKVTQYTYREAALNPTNPANKAREWEADIISEFRDNPDRSELVVTRETPAGSFLTLAQPLKVSGEHCLLCHSTAERAPPTMTAFYGTQNGFGWKLGEIIGVQIVSMPLTMALAQARPTFLLIFAGLVGALISVIGIVYLAIGLIVVKPVKEISNKASEISLGRLSAPELVDSRRDEIGLLAAAFNRMRRSLLESVRMLEMQR